MPLWGMDHLHFHDPWRALLLSHVSFRWRSIARNNQILWRDLYPLQTRFAVFCSELAPTVGLQVILDFHPPVAIYEGSDGYKRLPQARKDMDLWGYTEAFRFIYQNASRISTLLIFGSHKLMYIFLATPFPALTTHIFDFNLWPSDQVPLFGGCAPKLQNAMWTCWPLPLPSSAVPWSNLKSLHFPSLNDAEPTGAYLLHVLRLNPNLETLKVRVPGVKWIPDSLPLSKLRRAHFTVNNIKEWNSFYQALSRIPQIRDLTIDIRGLASMPALCSVLKEQGSVIPLFTGADNCSIESIEWTASVYPSLVHEGISMCCWNDERGTRVQLNIYPLRDLKHPEKPASEPCILFSNITTVTRLKFVDCPSFLFSIPQLTSITILDLQDTRYLKNLEMWIYAISVDTFPSLTAIILPKDLTEWRWEYDQRILERLVPNSPKPEIVVAGEDMPKDVRGKLEQFCNEYDVHWRFGGLK
ncbi:hypothetical protein M422DRAFT_781358 [Sphaerobolus stellatus SS14]|uniref:Unplaced genomic scaffold SPHSTscaffold_84, whole genome shotgun sequence n=1 Tax=Sphaerobolus stellatus (strain SS14) TaxID=990650 RepID=A0A0C9VLW5_SPHS4|nr:hypothetical protein M422DRAFT_781358 [Sphaerobolus stellatus SS14]